MNEVLWSGCVLAVMMLCVMVLPFMLFSSPTNLDEIKDQYFNDILKVSAKEVVDEKED